MWAEFLSFCFHFMKSQHLTCCTEFKSNLQLFEVLQEQTEKGPSIFLTQKLVFVGNPHVTFIEVTGEYLTKFLYNSNDILSVEDPKEKKSPESPRSLDLLYISHTGKPHRSISSKR